MSDNRSIRSYSPTSEDEREWISFIDKRARRKQEKAQRSRNTGTDDPSDDSVVVSSKMSHKGDKQINNKSPEWKRCLAAARWIPRAYDMYCVLEEAIRVSQIIGDVEQNTDSDNELDDESSAILKAAYDNIVASLDVNVILRHQSVYGYLRKEAPYLMHLILNKEHQTRAVLVREMQNVINCTRSDDASHLRPVIGSYAAPHPNSKGLDPPVQPGTTKDRLGFNHPELARLLCPIRLLQEMLANPVDTKKRIMSGNIKVTAQKNPAFLYEGDIPGENFDPEDAAFGFMRGYLLERVMKHIFTSPSSALSSSKTHNTRSSNGKLHNMRRVEANHIAYAATHARFAICSQNKFVDLDVDFKLPDFYYRIATFIADEISEEWSNDLYAHYNKVLFGNPRGLGYIVDDTDGDEDEDDIAIMKKQMANKLNDHSSSRSRASTAVEERRSVSRYTPNLETEDLYGGPSMAAEEDAFAGHHVNDEIDDARSRASTAANETTASTATSKDADAVDSGDVDHGLNRVQEPSAPVVPNKSKKVQSNASDASNKTTLVAQTSKAKAKAQAIAEDDEDSPLTDANEDESAGKKRKKKKSPSVPVRKSTRVR